MAHIAVCSTRIGGTFRKVVAITRHRRRPLKLCSGACRSIEVDGRNPQETPTLKSEGRGLFMFRMHNHSIDELADMMCSPHVFPSLGDAAR